MDSTTLIIADFRAQVTTLTERLDKAEANIVQLTDLYAELNGHMADVMLNMEGL